MQGDVAFAISAAFEACAVFANQGVGTDAHGLTVEKGLTAFVERGAGPAVQLRRGIAGVNAAFVRSLHNEIAGHAQLDIAALHLDVGPSAQQGDVFVRRHQHVLLAGADFHALICSHLDAVVLGLQQQLTVLGDMAHVTALGEQADAGRWQQLADGLGDYHVALDGELLLDRETPLRESHRHLSNLIGIHPFNLITIEGGDEDRRRIGASLDAWDSLGTDWWCGYSWSWMGCLRARVGDGEQALRHLDVFAQAFTSRNGFHVNGDQSGSGFSKFSYRPFTLEGNFAAMQVTHEMLLQSWSPTPGTAGSEVVRLFPAMPWRWHDARFGDLRAEGGHLVSAQRENNATTWLKIVAGTDGTVRIRDNFGGSEPRWSLPGVTRVGHNCGVFLLRGQAVQATMDRPAAPPPEPENAARPVILQATP